MNVLISVFYFVIAIALLIIVHEWGHFIVARMCGVKVLRFSVGFGRTIFRYLGRKGTEYVVAVVPLGGYVKMLDEEEGPVKEDEKQYAFNRKPLLARMAIVAAGPLLNMLFAVLALWLMFVIGIRTLAPITASIEPQSIAARAHLEPMDEILSIGDRKVINWRDFQLVMVTHIGAIKNIPVDVKNINTGKLKQLEFSLRDWVIDPHKPDVLKSLGIKPFIPMVEPIVETVVNNLPAAAAGIKHNDLITAIDGVKIKDWMQVLEIVRKSPNKPLLMSLKRDGKYLNVTVIPRLKKQGEESVGYIGLSVQAAKWPNGWLRVQRHSIWKAIGESVTETWHLTVTSFKMLEKFITGKVSLRNIGGPIGIAQGAGQSARGGAVYYLSFLALVSVSLGVLNILPIPMLDGGHLLFYVIEAVIRRPLSKEVKEKCMLLGLILLLMLTVLAVFNDVTRLMH